jgi:hypothetical protein
MLKLPSFFKTPSHRRFELKTRYYDSEKESFNERVNQARMQGSGVLLSEIDSLKSRVKNKYEEHRNRRVSQHSTVRRFRIITIVAVLTALTYWILK